MTQILERPPLSVVSTWLGLIRCFPGLYSLTTVIRIIVFAGIFQATGLIIRFFFDSLTASAPLAWGPNAWAAVILAVALLRNGLIFTDMYVFFRWTFSTAATMRKNLLEHILSMPGARSLPGSTGEAISRFREDAEEVGNFTVWALFLLATGIFGVAALFTMARINLLVTIFAFLPLLIVVAVANLARVRVQQYREANRSSAGDVTGFIGEMFEGVQAVQVANAEESMLAHFEELNESRRKNALRDRLFNEVLSSTFHNVVNIGMGLILLLAGSALREGSFTIGDFSLFAYYLSFISGMIATIGTFVARWKQAGVSIDRMDRLLQGAEPAALVRKTPIYIDGTFPSLREDSSDQTEPLRTLSTTGLTYRFPGSEKGITDVDLRLEQGSFTVVTGRIGAGKTTLLRVLLGLLPAESGKVHWNGRLIREPASFFVPPVSAYISQTPSLFSESLRENILLGLDADDEEVAQAVRAAVLESDLVQLENGLETVVGPRGVRLSGGQRQRAAAARMFIRQAALLVCDDLSSALDLETEQQLWERLFARQGATYLVVSHRRPLLRRADQIVVLKSGRVEDAGRLEPLLERCPEMRTLWEGRASDEDE
ncbi:MAG: ABC transporter ATP-binding protein [Caldilineaceae bacterium SB0661_bin_32]|uniref:ABC transporter ATP-binding protein n=1 Tax=Caldilineaceae bacterium SB0661_bin_32 TaxID=2605255 RepID=A0A6B1DCB9_9CHLR|nr:ABC transporter ATP-binding protein [Caldilineaceae bacterium SB0661_bin_32]